MATQLLHLFTVLSLSEHPGPSTSSAGSIQPTSSTNKRSHAEIEQEREEEDDLYVFADLRVIYHTNISI